MYSMSGDPPSWVCVRPSDGLRGLVVVAGVLYDLPPQLSHRGEDAARENVAFNLRKPELNLIEPRRVRRREVKVHMGMLRQERSDLLGFVRGEIVENEMQRAVGGLRRDDLAQEREEVVRRVTGGGLPDDVAALRVQRRIQRQRPVPSVLEPVPLGAAGRERQ